MIDRLRDLLDRPLDRGTAQTIVALAAAVTFAFGALVALGIVGRPSTSDVSPAGPTAVLPSAPARQAENPAPEPQAADEGTTAPAQDPQDRKGSAAYGRVHRAADTHRAMQHLPYRIGHVTFALVGANNGRAVVRVEGPTIAAARRSWRRFLRRFDDDGGAYVTRFAAGPRNGITRRRKVAGEGARGGARTDGTDSGARRAVPHHTVDRSARRDLTSKPHPKESP